MKRCDICNEGFNPHEEDTCITCREQSRAVTFEMYSELRDLFSDFGKAVEEFVNQEKAKGKAEFFQNKWKEKFNLLLEKLDC